MTVWRLGYGNCVSRCRSLASANDMAFRDRPISRPISAWLVIPLAWTFFTFSTVDICSHSYASFRTNGKSRYPFRFQKRVSGHSRLGLPAIPDRFNVGHYSVTPDFQVISSLPNEQLVPYVLSLLYNSTSVLLEKQNKLGGFNALLFRSKFLLACESLGCEISDNAP